MKALKRLWRHLLGRGLADGMLDHYQSRQCEAYLRLLDEEDEKRVEKKLEENPPRWEWRDNDYRIDW